MSSMDTDPRLESGSPATVGGGDADEVELARMGYKQELKYVLSCLLALASCSELHPVQAGTRTAAGQA